MDLLPHLVDSSFPTRAAHKATCAIEADAFSRHGFPADLPSAALAMSCLPATFPLPCTEHVFCPDMPAPVAASVCHARIADTAPRLPRIFGFFWKTCYLLEVQAHGASPGFVLRATKRWAFRTALLDGDIARSALLACDASSMSNIASMSSTLKIKQH